MVPGLGDCTGQRAQQGAKEQCGCGREDNVMRGGGLPAAARDRTQRQPGRCQGDAPVKLPAIDAGGARLSAAPGQDQGDRNADDHDGAACEGTYR